MKIDEYLRRAESIPPVVVVQAGDVTGLGILRDLAELDVPALALDADPHAPGLRSGLAPAMVSPDAADDEGAFLAFLEHLGRRLPQRAVLFAAAEQYLWTLSRYAEQLASCFILPYAPWPVMRRLAEGSWGDAAAEVGLDVAGDDSPDGERWSLGSYLDAQSRALAVFTGHLTRRRHGSAPGRVAVGAWDGHVADTGARLLKELGYHGVSQVEFSRGADGGLQLVAIKAGHWPWHVLATVSGVNLSLAAYRDATGRPYVSRGQTDGRKWLVPAGMLSLRDPLPGLFVAGRRVRSLFSRGAAPSDG